MFDRWDMMEGWGGSAGIWMLGGMIVIAVAVIVSVWLFTRSRHESRSSGSAALEILEQRFARGEITRDEFEAAKVALSK